MAIDHAHEETDDDDHGEPVDNFAALVVVSDDNEPIIDHMEEDELADLPVHELSESDGNPPSIPPDPGEPIFPAYNAQRRNAQRHNAQRRNAQRRNGDASKHKPHWNTSSIPGGETTTTAQVNGEPWYGHPRTGRKSKYRNLIHQGFARKGSDTRKGKRFPNTADGIW